MTDLDRAREIFHHYEGSRFHMDRDGASEEYLKLSVPREVEQGWMAEITRSHLEKLASAEGWNAVYFLRHHQEFGYLEEIVAAPSSGVFWQRCAYEELLLEYLDRCVDGALSGPVRAPLRYDSAAIARALDRVEGNADALRGRVRSDRSVRRAEALSANVSRRRAAAASSPVGFWRWSNVERVAVPAHR